MRAKTLLTILFLLSLGVAAWLFLHALPQNATADVQPLPKEEVLVAAVPLSAGTLLRADDVVWRPAAGVVEPGTVVRPLAAVHTERDEQARNEVSGAALNVDLATAFDVIEGADRAPTSQAVNAVSALQRRLAAMAKGRLDQ